MNSTKWPSLTEFAKFLGREGICRVEDDEKGLHVAWIDNSPDALRRQDAIRKKDRQDKGDEEREQALIRDQVRKAQLDAESRGETDPDETEKELKRADGEKIKLSFGAKPASFKVEPDPEASSAKSRGPGSAATSTAESAKDGEQKDKSPEKEQVGSAEAFSSEAAAPAKLSLKMGFSSKPKNVFAAAKKNALGGKKAAIIEQPKKMSEAERIMREEIERKNKRGSTAFGGPAQKKQRF